MDAPRTPRDVGPGPGLRLELFPDDMDAFAGFWTDVLRFRVLRDERRAPQPYLYLARGTVRVGAVRPTAATDVVARRPPTGVEIVLEVDDLEEELAHVRSRWPLEEDLVRRPWGLSDFRVLDPAGYYVRVTSPS